MKTKLASLVMIVIFSVPCVLQAQVYGTGQTLRSGRASFGVEPVVYSYRNGNSDFYLFFHGGLGLTSGFDLGARLGVLGNRTYFGGDFEWNLHSRNPAISLGVGVHSFHNVGLDGTVNISFASTRGLQMYSGLDMDVTFTDPGTRTPIWLPVGFAFPFRQTVEMLLEVEVGLNDEAWTILGGGVNFYF
ncbi:MAG TPA: hypothetical protein VKA68_13820 [bacterium]|nr:hypothetical protein [bacterium]